MNIDTLNLEEIITSFLVDCKKQVEMAAKFYLSCLDLLSDTHFEEMTDTIRIEFIREIAEKCITYHIYSLGTTLVANLLYNSDINKDNYDIRQLCRDIMQDALEKKIPTINKARIQKEMFL